jgi:hypothetical protein
LTLQTKLWPSSNKKALNRDGIEDYAGDGAFVFNVQHVRVSGLAVFLASAVFKAAIPPFNHVKKIPAWREARLRTLPRKR